MKDEDEVLIFLIIRAYHVAPIVDPGCKTPLCAGDVKGGELARSVQERVKITVSVLVFAQDLTRIVDVLGISNSCTGGVDCCEVARRVHETVNSG